VTIPGVTIPDEACKIAALQQPAATNVAHMSTTTDRPVQMTAEPQPRLNNTPRGLDTLPLCIVPA
jgi:hypothetical protein